MIALLRAAGYAIDPVARRLDGEPLTGDDAVVILALVAGWCADQGIPWDHCDACGGTGCV